VGIPLAGTRAFFFGSFMMARATPGLSFSSFRAPHVFICLFSEHPMSSLASVLSAPHLLAHFLSFLFRVSERLRISYFFPQSVPCHLLRSFSECPIFSARQRQRDLGERCLFSNRDLSEQCLFRQRQTETQRSWRKISIQK